MSEQKSTLGGWFNEADARQAVGGALGDTYRNVLRASCAPLYWHPQGKKLNLEKLRNGTATIVRTPERLFGVTAAHVVSGIRQSQAEHPQTIQLMDLFLPELTLIGMDEELDLATFELTENDLIRMGKKVSPLSIWPPRMPKEKGGILIGGYPKLGRVVMDRGVVEWGMLVAIGIVDQIVRDQIVWTIERDFNIPHPTIPDVPANACLGGISGGPVLALIETGGLQYQALAGIVVQGNSAYDFVIARRADYIQADGSILRN